jgi:hypothetical protein
LGKKITSMKNKTFLLLSCFIYVYGIEAQQNVGISMGPSYMYDIYYSLEKLPLIIAETVPPINSPTNPVV